MWKISFHVKRAHLINPTCLGGKSETVKGLTKKRRQRKGESIKRKEKKSATKEATLGQRREHFPLIGSVTKGGRP